MINWSAQPAPIPPSEISFAGKFVNITNFTSNLTIDSVKFSWLASEANVTPYVESAFRIFDYNGSWRQEPPVPMSHSLTLNNVSSFSVFGILQIPLSSSGGGPSGGGSTPALSISFDNSTDTATVSSDGSPVPGATVKVNGMDIGLTDSNGQIVVPGCG